MATVSTVVNIVIACSTMLGNGMVIFIMTVRRRQFSSFTNCLIRHQSIVDFVSGVMLLTLKVVKPTTDTIEVEEGLWGLIVCHVIQTDVLLWAVNVASTYNLVVISLERYMATCYPVKHRNSCSLYRIRILMCLTWVVGFLDSLFLINFFHVVQKVCQFDQDIPLRMLLVALDSCIQYLGPVSFMLFAYTRIILVLKRKQVRAGNANQRPCNDFSKAKRNVIEIMLIAVILFVICWTPPTVLRLKIVFSNQLTPPSAYTAVVGLLTVNMCVNPIICCFKYKHFRLQLHGYLREKFRCNHVGTVQQCNRPSLIGTDQHSPSEMSVRRI